MVASSRAMDRPNPLEAPVINTFRLQKSSTVVSWSVFLDDEKKEKRFIVEAVPDRYRRTECTGLMNVLWGIIHWNAWMVAAPVVPVVSRRNGITITENGNSNITGLGVVVVPCAVDRMINIDITRRSVPGTKRRKDFIRLFS